MDDLRLGLLLEYFNLLAKTPLEHYRLKNVANAIEKELGIAEPLSGTNPTLKKSI